MTATQWLNALFSAISAKFLALSAALADINARLRAVEQGSTGMTEQERTQLLQASTDIAALKEQFGQAMQAISAIGTKMDALREEVDAQKAVVEALKAAGVQAGELPDIGGLGQ